MKTAVGEGADERKAAINATAPRHAGSREPVAMAEGKPCFPFAVADLLPPVRNQASAVVVPHQRRRCKGDPPSAVLKSPAHVHVVAGAKEDRVEPPDGQQRLATRSEVAARNVLRLTIVEHHMAGRARRTRNTL